MKMTDTYAPRKDIAYRKYDGEMVLVSPMENVLLRLNETASLIFEQLETNTIGQIARSVADTFEVDIETARRDTSAFMALLVKRDLVRIRKETERR